MGEYIDPDDLRLALGQSRYVALFDDDNDGEVETAAVEQVILRAESRFNRYASVGYDDVWPPTPAPDSFRAFVLDYAILYAEVRGNFVDRDKAEQRLEALDVDAADVAKSLTKLSNTQPNPTPALADDAGAPPGALGASFVGFNRDCDSTCTNGEWIRKEGCR